MRKVVVPLLLVAFVGGIYLVPAALNARSTQLADAWDVNTDLRAGYAETPEQAADRLWQHVKKACLTRYEQLGAKHAPLVPAELDVPGAVQARNAQNAFLLTCHMTERVERLCIPAHKAKMVRLIRGHFHNIELDGSNLADAEAGLAAAEMRARAGSPELDPLLVNRRFGEALRGLVRAGYLARRDFASFVSLGVPTSIAGVIADAKPAGDPCAIFWHYVA